MKNFNLPVLASGAGLRHKHFSSILKNKPAFNWFEVITEDFMDYSGHVKETLQEIRKSYPIICHGVCMSVGSTDPLDLEYLKNLKLFLRDIDSAWASDHLCFTMIDHTNLNDLIPLPFTEEAVRNTVERLRVIQDSLELPFLVENVTRYITVSDREMSESEFISRILEEADCGLLLDITNVYLNSKFHGYDADNFIDALPLERVGQIHLAGWEPMADGKIIDSHDAPVPPEVWQLFKRTIQKTGKTSVLIEWDKSLPEVDRLLAECQTADQAMDEALAAREAA